MCKLLRAVLVNDPQVAGGRRNHDIVHFAALLAGCMDGIVCQSETPTRSMSILALQLADAVHNLRAWHGFNMLKVTKGLTSVVLWQPFLQDRFNTG